MSTNFETILFEVNDGIGLLTINREKKLNALNKQVLEELHQVLDLVKKNHWDGLRGIVFTGAGEKAFIAGADIAAMSDMNQDEANSFARYGQEVTLAFESLSIPVIAAVNGFCLGGGCEMAMACDFILASSNAVFGQPEVKLGLIPGFGGTQRLSKYLGRNLARELVYTGRNMTVEEAQAKGLVLEVLPSKSELIEKAKGIIQSCMKNSPLAVGISKKVMNEGNDLTVEKGLDIEANHFAELFNSEDFKEGTKAFVEKRKPNFTGR